MKSLIQRNGNVFDITTLLAYRYMQNLSASGVTIQSGRWSSTDPRPSIVSKKTKTVIDGHCPKTILWRKDEDAS